MGFYHNYTAEYQQQRKDQDHHAFLRRYDAHVRMTTRQVPQYQSIPMWDDYKSKIANIEVKYETFAELQISEKALLQLIEDVNLVDEISRRYGRGPNALEYFQRVEATAAIANQEARTRIRNPAVQLAWEKYQMLLKIAGE